jgi:high affinity Mn2+ porin
MQDGKSQSTIHAWLIALLAMILAGVVPANEDNPWLDSSTNRPVVVPMRLRTFPEALRAYLHCLHSHPPAQQSGEKPETSEADKAEKDNNDNKEEHETWYRGHAQTTVVTQEHDHFRSPYVGRNSLLPDEDAPTSLTSTVFFDARLWEGGELVFNPELSGGRGFSGTTGLGGFSNGEITRVGVVEPTPYIARLFLRQAFEFGGELEKVEDGPNQIAGMRDVERLTVSIGKFSAEDQFDDNRYSHDPRTQFLNWSLMYNGAWDYPANVRGYTYGITFDYNQKDWAIRYGIFAEPAVANGAPLDPRFLRANGQVLEWEERYTVNDHAGKLRLMGYLNRAHMGNYNEAVALMPTSPDITLTRAYRIKYGFGLNLEQELSSDLGAFVRLGWNDGRTETWAFTEIDMTVAAGLELKGRCWCRPRDRLGLAAVCNGLSPEHRNYLADGGFGFIIGDGKLTYGLEKIIETYYNLEIARGINLMFDFQGVDNPAYNRDRGPVAIGSLRVHLEF